LRTFRTLFARELGAYFFSPVAYVVMAVFLAMTGHLFYLTIDQLTAAGPKGVEFPMQMILGDPKFWLVFLFIPPLLTMRLFAEEASTGTIELLMTAPVREWQVVMSKFAGCLVFYLILWIPTLIYVPIMSHYGQIDLYPVWCSYVGVVLAGAMFLALGMFVSSMVTSQMAAALLSMFIGLVFIIVGIWRPVMDPASALSKVLFYFTVPFHFEKHFARGLLDTRHVILYVTTAALFVYLSIRSLEGRKWR